MTNDNAQHMDLAERQSVLSQIEALRNKKSPLSDAEWARLLALLHELHLERH
jgi:hypothetical protein